MTSFSSRIRRAVVSGAAAVLVGLTFVAAATAPAVNAQVTSIA